MSLMTLDQFQMTKEVVFSVLENVAVESRPAYNRALEEFMTFSIERYGSNPYQNPFSILVAYKSELQAEYKPATVNQRLSVVRKFYESALAAGLISYEQYLVASRVKNVSNAGYIERNWLETSEMNILIGSIDVSTLRGKRDRALVVFFLVLGLRRNEIRNLTWENMEDNWIVINTKGNKDRKVYIPERYMNILREYSSCEEGFIFRNVDRWGNLGDQLSNGGINYILNKYGVRPHDLRRTSANMVYEQAEGDLEVVQAHLGHQSRNTTELYVKPFDIESNPTTELIELEI